MLVFHPDSRTCIDPMYFYTYIEHLPRFFSTFNIHSLRQGQVHSFLAHNNHDVSWIFMTLMSVSLIWHLTSPWLIFNFQGVSSLLPQRDYIFRRGTLSSWRGGSAYDLESDRYVFESSLPEWLQTLIILYISSSLIYILRALISASQDCRSVFT